MKPRRGRRAGRKRKLDAPRTASGRIVQEPVGPTPELLARRAEFSDTVAAATPEAGTVLGRLLLAGLLDPEPTRASDLHGAGEKFLRIEAAYRRSIGGPAPAHGLELLEARGRGLHDLDAALASAERIAAARQWQRLLVRGASMMALASLDELVKLEQEAATSVFPSALLPFLRAGLAALLGNNLSPRRRLDSCAPEAQL